MLRNRFLAIALVFALPLVAFSQGRGNRQQGDGQPNQFNRTQQQNQQSQQGDGSQRTTRPLIGDEPPVVTQHSIMLHGKELKYTATTGYIPIKNKQTGETEA